MRDYLEALLEEQQEPEREAPALPEEPAVGGNYRRDGGEAPEREAAASAVQPFEIERERSAAPDGETAPVERAGTAEWLLETGLGPTAAAGAENARRAASAVEEAEAAEPWSGGALYADLVRREAAAAWPETAVRRAQPMPLSRPGSPAGGETVTLAELDRAVQRDARRYDGPFPLY